jgi:hypothetical protein
MGAPVRNLALNWHGIKSSIEATLITIVTWVPKPKPKPKPRVGAGP